MLQLRVLLLNFVKFKGPFNTFKEIRDGDKTLQEIEEDQKKLKSSLDEITSGNPKHKREYQLDTIKNVQSLYDSRQKVIDLFNDNANIKSEDIYQSKQNVSIASKIANSSCTSKSWQ